MKLSAAFVLSQPLLIPLVGAVVVENNVNLPVARQFRRDVAECREVVVSAARWTERVKQVKWDGGVEEPMV